MGIPIITVLVVALCWKHLAKLILRCGGGKENRSKPTEKMEKTEKEGTMQQQSPALGRGDDVSVLWSSMTSPLKRENSKLELTKTNPVSQIYALDDEREFSL